MRALLLAVTGISLGLLGGCNGGGDTPYSGGGDTPSKDIDPSRNAYAATDDPLGEPVTKVVYLNQNWSAEQSTQFYFTPQGSHLVPYDWFMALEQPDSTTLFRDNKNILKYRYLPQNHGPMNPDGLPVGFVADEGTDRRWLGFTCAACHTNEIRLGNTAYRIDGAPTHADAEAFLSDLVLALRQTRDDPAKLKRFIGKVGNPKPEVITDQLTKMIAIRDGYNRRNFLGYDPNASTAAPPTRYGTLDAVDSIVNEVFWRTVKSPDPKNPTVVAKPCNASVSYPFLWDTPQHDKVEWLGIAANGEKGDSIDGIKGNLAGLPRNVGEVLGVFGEFVVHDNPNSLLDIGYSSSVRFTELLQINDLMKTLWSPEWPSDFPPIDQAAATAGKTLYEKESAPGIKDSCLDCHAIVNRKTLDRTRVSIIAAMSDTGTDRQASDNFLLEKRPSGKLQGIKGIESPTVAEPVVTNVVKGVLFGFYRSAPPDPLKTFHYEYSATKSIGPPEAKYKGRPLDGIWATAPYLHNGSVPTLDALLQPQEARPKSFSIGTRTFDPVNVGYSIDVPGFPKFQVIGKDGKTIPGHSNWGHQYGSKLTPVERKQLVEYLKTL